MKVSQILLDLGRILYFLLTHSKLCRKWISYNVWEKFKNFWKFLKFNASYAWCQNNSHLNGFCNYWGFHMHWTFARYFTWFIACILIRTEEDSVLFSLQTFPVSCLFPPLVTSLLPRGSLIESSQEKLLSLAILGDFFTSLDLGFLILVTQELNWKYFQERGFLKGIAVSYTAR